MPNILFSDKADSDSSSDDGGARGGGCACGWAWG